MDKLSVEIELTLFWHEEVCLFLVVDLSVTRTIVIVKS